MPDAPRADDDVVILVALSEKPDELSDREDLPIDVAERDPCRYFVCC